MIQVGLLVGKFIQLKINVAIFILVPSFNYIWLSNKLKLILRFCYLNYICCQHTSSSVFGISFWFFSINENENEDVKYVLSLEH